jgi:hypothetical protein
MECAERARLENNYTTARVILDAARVRVEQRIETCRKSDFLVLSNALGGALTELERSRAALDAHIQEHCCIVLGNSIEQD